MVDFTNSVRQVLENRLNSVYTSIPAVVNSYRNGKAEVKIAVNISGREKLPVLSDVPIMFPCSSSAGIVFEVSKGDPVLLVFTNSSIDEWLQSSGKDTETDDPRRFDLTDAVAIPCLFPFSDAPKLDTGDGCVINYDDTTITIKKSGDIVLGGATAKALVTESVLGVIAGHTHTVPQAPSGTTESAPSAGLATLATNPANKTSVVTAE